MKSFSKVAIPLDSIPEAEDEMARLRPVAMSRALKNISDEVYLSHDDPFIDFSSAGLYLVGLQTTVATVACAAASIASCWLLPSAMISAVRTLAITALTGFLCMRKPIRVGRVRGVTTIFNALRPCIIMYIAVLTIEQLVHTCVPSDHKPNGYTRRVVFHSMIAVMAASGLWRAGKPTSESDGPFMVTALAVVVVAMLPPLASPLSGPLCEATSMFGAGERLLRAFFFAALYVIHVYCSPPQRNSIHDLAVCIMRCAAASTWVLGCHLFIIWLPIVQATVALWARFGQEPTAGNYANVDTRSDSGLSDAELGGLSNDYKLDRDANGVLVAPWARDPIPGVGRNGFHMEHFEMQQSPEDMQTTIPISSAIPLNGASTPSPGPGVSGTGEVAVDARQLASLVGQNSACGKMSKARMAELAAAMQ